MGNVTMNARSNNHQLRDLKNKLGKLPPISQPVKSKPGRSTFRLSRFYADGLRMLASWHRVSEKEAIDDYARLFFDSNDSEKTKFFDGALEWHAKQTNTGERKSRVLSQKTLSALAKAAERTGIARDMVLECLILVALASKSAARERELESLRRVHQRLEKVIEFTQAEEFDMCNELKDFGIDVSIPVDIVVDEKLGEIRSRIEQLEKEEREHESLLLEAN